MEYKKTIGVLGGMGPAATADFLGKLVKFAQAEKDQDHPRVVIDCNAKIPDRIVSILDNGPDPLSTMLRSVKYLEIAPVDYIVIPCVTAHYFHSQLQANASVPILHIVRETVSFLTDRYPHVKKVGTIATLGTIKSGLISDICDAAGINCIVPDDVLQASAVAEAIHQIKMSGLCPTAKHLVHIAAESLIAKGAQAIIAGCTEVPLVLSDGDLSVPVLDPSAILAQQALRMAL
jgi:aspartate racemase